MTSSFFNGRWIFICDDDNTGSAFQTFKRSFKTTVNWKIFFNRQREKKSQLMFMSSFPVIDQPPLERRSTQKKAKTIKFILCHSFELCSWRDKPRMGKKHSKQRQKDNFSLCIISIIKFTDGGQPSWCQCEGEWGILGMSLFLHRFKSRRFLSPLTTKKEENKGEKENERRRGYWETISVCEGRTPNW